MIDPFIERARQLILQGQTAEARRQLQQYVTLYGNNAEAWLLLAAVSTPKASLEYVHKALALEPNNPVAQRALKWAEGRVDKPKLELPAIPAANQEPAPTTPLKPIAKPEPPIVAKPAQAEPGLADKATAPATPEPTAEKTVVARPASLRRRTPAPAPAPEPEAEGAPTLWERFTQATPLALRIGSIAAVILMLCLATGFVIVNITQANQPAANAIALAGDIAKATLTFTPTFTATDTNTPTATFTFTPTATDTAIPTDTATATATPTDTATPIPTDTPTPVPTDTPIPPTATAVFVPPTAVPAAPAAVDPPVGNGERWIEVNLTNQTLTAWEGTTAVNTFLVSSGKPGHLTLPGTFHIYIKLRYAHMIGPDYDTPDVPNTMYYDGDFAIHGAYWHNSFGTPVSHGCVNLNVPNSAWLFDWASVGTTVKIHY